MFKRIKIRNILITLAFPVFMFIAMEAICLTAKGTHIINSSLDIKMLIRNTGISAIIAFALSFNLSSGRFDLSLGAQRLAGTIIGGILAINLGLSDIWFILFSLGFGLLFGFLTGMLFVLTRVPPMVLGIGLGLIWECVPYVVSQGKGLNMFGVADVTLLTQTNFIIVLVIVVAAFVMILMNKTRFGYNVRSIQGSQRISQNSGINIFANAVGCYTLAGGLVCIAGMIDAAYTTQITASLGLVSNSVVVANMFPMLLGGYIGRRSNQSFGIVVAAFTLEIFALGLSYLELSEANTTVCNMVLFVAFLVFLANEHVLAMRKFDRERIAQAQEKKKSMSLA